MKIKVNWFITEKGNKICVLILLFSLLMASCEEIFPTVEIPSYVHIDSIGLATSPTIQGTNSHKITDAWVYLDNNLIGVFELPVTVPVLAYGSHLLTIRPGIMMDGIASTRARYPYYTFKDSAINLIKEKVSKVNISSTYFSGVTFAWMENFEGQGVTLERTLQSDTAVQLQIVRKDSAFEGNGSGHIVMSSKNYIFEYVSSDKFILPRGIPVYLELNYKCNQSFLVGMFANTSTQVIQESGFGVNPTSTWKKIYINLQDLIILSQNTFEYKVYITARNDNSVAFPEFYFDNIKLIY